MTPDTRPAAPATRAMTVADLDRVMAIEVQAYPFPWSRGNLIDSLAAGYCADLLLDGFNAPMGYFVAMPGVGELHLLNLTIAPAWQGQGHGRALLAVVEARARERGLGKLWLEVRVSNLRAQQMYLGRGFVQHGIRRGYYPAPSGQREDAVVMSLVVGPESIAHEHNAGGLHAAG